MINDLRTVPAALDRLVRQLPDHTALIAEDRRFTSTELRDAVYGAAAALIALGVEPADRVAIWSPNTWHWVVACLAIHHAGAAVVPLNTRYTATEATDILDRAGAPVLFGRANVVFTLLVVPTSELLALHAEVHRLCGPHLAPAPMANSLPGQWTAHVTLARRVGGHQLGRALRIAGRPSRIDGRFAGLRRWDGNTRAEYLLG